MAAREHRANRLDDSYFMDEGYFRDSPIVTSVGIFEYAHPDGSMRRDLRLPEPPSYFGMLPCPVIDNGIPSMREIFNQTTKWFERTGCVHLINPDLITKYALMTVRWLVMESIATKCLIYKDKNGDHFPNTMSDMAIKYSKAADAAWAQIWEIVQQNSVTYYGDSPRHDYTSFLINNKPAR